MTPAEAGRLGGMTTAARHGPAHMARIGARGFAVYAARHHGGNRAAAKRILRLDGRRRDFEPIPPEWTDWLTGREQR